jgi:transcriptional regulator with XRE-family HTH domain
MIETKIPEMSPGERIRLLRERRGLLQKELAEKTGLSVQTISNLERGKGAPSISTIKKIAETLGVPPTVFFEDDVKRKRLLRDELKKKMALVEQLVENEDREKAKQVLDEILELFNSFGEEIAAAGQGSSDQLQQSINESPLPEASKEILSYLYRAITGKKQGKSGTS